MFFIDDILFPEKLDSRDVLVRKPINYLIDNDETASDEYLTTEISIPREFETLNIEDKQHRPAGKFLSDLLKETEDVEFIDSRTLKVTNIPK